MKKIPHDLSSKGKLVTTVPLTTVTLFFTTDWALIFAYDAASSATAKILLYQSILSLAAVRRYRITIRFFSSIKAEFIDKYHSFEAFTSSKID